jgi:hypothetical protein
MNNDRNSAASNAASNKDKFNRLLSDIRNQHVDDTTVAQASQRVWKSIAGSPANPDFATGTLRSCADFQSLIPAYVAKQLTPARIMLFEDHTHACVACRHALESARDERARETSSEARTAQIVHQFKPQRPRTFAWRWAMSAAAVGAVALALFALSNGFFPGQHSVRGDVQAVDGSMYAVSGTETRLVRTGYEFRNGDMLRTAKGSTAIVRLLDGSLIEVGERSGLSVSRGWKGVTVHLNGGQVIVQAAKQRTGRLYVATDDGLVSVKGTIFSVKHGIKGSRVAVIEGVVRASFGDNTTDLKAGDEATSSPSVSQVPIRNEIAWSRNSAKYLALLGDFAVLQKQLAAIPGPGLRYNSELLSYVPDNTVVYAAIPNLSNTLGEATRLFQERLEQSPDLRNWWRQQQKGSGPKLEQVLGRFKTFSSYLGDEIVLAIGKDGTKYTSPVILAKIRQNGLEESLQNEGNLEKFLQKQSRQLSSNPSQITFQVVHDPWSVTPAANHALLVYVSNDLLIASPELADLQRAVTRFKEGGHFSETPFYRQISHSYEQGAEFLFCVDMEQIVARNVEADSGRKIPLGINDVRYLTMEHREVNGKSESHADLSFASERQGVASWLAAPAPMGSLEWKKCSR